VIEIDVELQRAAFKLEAACSFGSPMTGLLGPSGAGKSTLLGMIAGYIKPDHGRIIVDDTCVFDSSQGIDVPLHQRRIAMVFQDSRLFPHLSVRDNLQYGLKLLPTAQRRFEYRQIIDLLEIGHLQKHRAHQLSGGEKQRVALGRALLASPRLLLLDEPLASLDVYLKNQILPFLRRVRDEIGIPMVYVSHSINEVLYLTSQVAIMSNGQLLKVGEFHEVMHDGQVIALAHTLGLENLVQGRLAAHDVVNGYSTVMLGQQQLHMPLVDTPVGNQVSASIAASGIALSRERLGGITIQNQLPGKVGSIHMAGGRALVSVDVEGNNILLAEITPKAVHDLQLEMGIQVYCLIKTQSVMPLMLRA
jgi:molybdate transport system ATP-binding protein